MIKKLIGVFLLFGLGMTSYFFFADDYLDFETEVETILHATPKPSEVEELDEEEAELAPLDIEKNKILPSPIPFQKSPRGDEEQAELEEYVEKTHERWDERIKKLLLEEMNLSANHFTAYLNMREQFYGEKEKDMDAYHEHMVNKYGPDYKFKPSEIDPSDEYEDRTLSRFHSKLQRTIGEENWAKYIEVIEKFNEELMLSREAKKGQVSIEF